MPEERTSAAFGALMEATRESFRAVMDGAAGAFEEQAEINQRTMRSLAEQFERQQEAAWALIHESSRAYAGLSPLPFRDGRATGGSLPIADYDELGVEEISGRLGDLDGSGIERLRVYERQHRNRRLVLERLDRSLV